MPHIRMRALKKEQVSKLSQTLVPELASLAKVPEDHFTLELVQTTFFKEGREIVSNPFVEIFWFARPHELQNEWARIITDQIVELTNAQDIVIVFRELGKTAYYENGEHF